jgi:hypothetical protein
MQSVHINLGTKLKETAWEEVASMINRFVFAHPNIY